MTGWRALLTLAVLLLPTTLAAPLAAKTLHPDYLLRTQRLQAFGTFQAGCDNLAECTGIGPLPCAGETPLVMVHWGAALADSPAIAVAGEMTLPTGQSDQLRGCLSENADYLAMERAVSQWRSIAPAVPAVPPLLTLPAVEQMVSGVPPALPPGHRCQGQVLQQRQFALVGSDTSLWQVRCDPASGHSYWFMWARGSLQLEPLVLPDAGRAVRDAGMAGLADVAFDFDFGILRTLDMHDGDAMCGERLVWGWTAQGWQQLERRERPLCTAAPDVRASDWIRTYQAPAVVARNEVDE